jgi:hypothetical protein
MSDQDLGKALLRGDDPIDVQALTLRVLRRDRRRIWSLGIVCVVAWMFVVLLPWATVLPMLAKIARHQAEISGGAAPAAAESTSQTTLMVRIIKEGTIATFLLCIASMLVAAICTVMLVIFSRRATLRQVNARLAQISAQLKTMAASGKTPGC